MSKIQFWKRITTWQWVHRFRQRLWLLCQRYNFESESQPYKDNPYLSQGCDCYVKDTILKANHNSLKLRYQPVSAVTAMSKIQFWKRITTLLRFTGYVKSCDCYVKDTILKANHNVWSATQKRICAVTAMSKIQFWKRITTVSIVSYSIFLLWLLCQRYNFESESQRLVVFTKLYFAVTAMSKIQFWKRITTVNYLQH